MAKYKIRNLKVFNTILWSSYQNISEKMGRRNSSQMFILKQREKCQNEYYPDNLNLISLCRCTSLHVLMFPISLLKRNLSSYWKWQTFEGKISSFFMTLKKWTFIFLKTHLFLIFVNMEIFFQEYIEMELKIFFIIFEGIFEWQN